MEPLGRNETQLHGSWPKPAIFKWKIICYIIFICQEWVYSRQMNWMSNSPKKGRGSGSFKQSVWDEFAATVRRQMLSTVLFHIFFSFHSLFFFLTNFTGVTISNLNFLLFFKSHEFIISSFLTVTWNFTSLSESLDHIMSTYLKLTALVPTWNIYPSVYIWCSLFQASEYL